MSFSFPQKLHLPHFSLKPLSALYFSFTLRFLSVSLVSVFIPIYILKLTGDFLYVLLFWAGFSFLVFLGLVLDGPCLWRAYYWRPSFTFFRFWKETSCFFM